MLFTTEGSGFCIGRRKLAELEAASGFAAGSHPLSLGFGGAGAVWVNTIGDINSDGVTVAGIRCGEMTWTYKRNCILDLIAHVLEVSFERFCLKAL